MKTASLLVFLALFQALTTSAAAEDLVKWSGLAVLGATYSSERRADFTSGIDHPNGAGGTRPTDWWSESRVMLQADAQLSPNVSAMLQGTAEHRYDNSFRPHVTAAALKWQLTPNIYLRLARQPFLNFLVTDDRVAWVRPTTEIYQTGLLNLYDGAELGWRTTTGDTTWHAQLYGGAIAYPVPGNTSNIDIQLNQLLGINLFATHGPHTLRVARIRGRLTMHSQDIDQAFARLRMLPGGMALSNHYQAVEAPTEHRSLAYCYQSERGYVLIEWSQFSTGESFVADSTQGHLTTGYHLGSITPFFTLAGKQANKVASDPNPILNALFSNRAVGQKSIVVGARWLIQPDTSVKMQLDYVINANNSIGSLSNLQPGFQPGQRYRLLSAALEHSF